MARPARGFKFNGAIAEPRSMVDLRPPVQFPGLNIRVRPGSNERFYLSGDTPPFTLVAENSTNDPFDGMIVVHWVPNVGSWLDGESLRVQLRAHETRDFPLKSPWLATEGVVTSRLGTNYEPRSLLSSPPGSPTPPPIGSFEFLCTFRVWDRGSYQSDRAERTRNLIILAIVPGIAAVAAILGLILHP